MIPFIASLALGSGGVAGGGGLLSSTLGNIPFVGSAINSVVSNPIGTIGTIGKAIGGLFSSNAGAVQLADKRTGTPENQGVILFLHDINQQTGGIWLAGENCPWMGSDWNDNISGVSVAPGFDLELYEDINYGGKKWSLSEGRADWRNYRGTEPHTDMFGGKWWNDRASSFKVIKMRPDAVSFAQSEAQSLQKINVDPTPPPRPYDTQVNTTNWKQYVGDIIKDSVIPKDTDTQEKTETPTKNNTWIFAVLALLGIGIYTKKIKF